MAGAAILAPALLTLGGCGGTEDGAGDEVEPIRIGATMSETGDYSTQGIPARNGYLMCAETLNDEGGLLGRPVEFVIHDDRSDSERARELYDTFLAGEDIDLILGPYGSSLTEAIAPITEAFQAVHITPLAATTSIWEQGRTHLFMVLPPAEIFLAGLIDIADANGYERVGVVHEDALFPAAAAKGAVEMARERGMEVVLDLAYPSGTEDFGPLAAQVEAQGVEVLGMAASNLADFISMVQQMKADGVEVELFGTSGAVTEFQEALGEDAEGTFGLSAWEPSLPHPGAAEFAAAYREDFGAEPSFHAAGAYGSCLLLAEAVRRGGSLDSETLRSELLALETTTPFGPFAVDERGYQIAHQGAFIQWQDGEKVVVWPAEVAAAAPRLPGR